MTNQYEILVVGASGATGSLLVAELLNRGHPVKAIVRSPEQFQRSGRMNTYP
ncbi:MAG: NAD(P)H-binding protein [Opitutaceae bacterium]